MNSAQLRFSIFYFCSVSLYSFIIAYFPIYCRNIGLGAFDIAVITSFGTLATVIGAPLALHLSHHTVPARRLFAVSIGLSFCMYFPLFIARTALGVGMCWLLFNLLKRSGDSLVDAQAIRFSESSDSRFEYMRIWGSIGFVITTLIFGYCVDTYGQSVILIGGATIVFFTLIASFPLRRDLQSTTGKSIEHSQKSALFSAGKFIAPFALTTLAFSLITASHSLLYTYFSLYLEALKWSATSISFAWNLGVCSEILMFAFFKHFEKRLGLQLTFVICCALTTARWLFLGLSADYTLILATQLLHSFSFGGCYLCAAKLVPHILPDHLSDRGQGIMIAVGFGIGSFLGRLFFGFIADGLTSYSEVQELFIIAASISLISFVLSIVLMKRSPKEVLESTIDVPELVSDLPQNT